MKVLQNWQKILFFLSKICQCITTYFISREKFFFQLYSTRCLFESASFFYQGMVLKNKKHHVILYRRFGQIFLWPSSGFYLKKHINFTLNNTNMFNVSYKIHLNNTYNEQLLKSSYAGNNPLVNNQLVTKFDLIY